MQKNLVRGLCFALLAGPLWAGTVTLDALSTGTNGYYRPETAGNYDWSAEGASFNLEVFESWGTTSWAGFTYSKVNDPSTSGFDNQYAVYGSGTDHSGSGVYAVAYQDAFNAVQPRISFASAVGVSGLYLNNTAYAALDMLNGSFFSRAFTTNDWFKVTIEGFDGGNASLGTQDVLLADFASYTDGAAREDFIVRDWTRVDLSGLGTNVSSLAFSLSSSDTGAWGMNTPAYFALDRIETIPEPASALLLLLGTGTVVCFRRLRNGSAT